MFERKQLCQNAKNKSESIGSSQGKKKRLSQPHYRNSDLRLN